MAELKNELKWSHTRQRRWDTCRRLYYLAHYAHWNGWRRDASPLQRTCYILSKMVSLPMFAGDVVHRIAEKALKDLRAGHTRSIDAWTEEARRLLNEGWQQSRAGKWREDPKRNTLLFEHYHRLPVGEADVARTRERVLGCVERLFAGPMWQRIRESDPARWRSIEELAELRVGAFGAWVKIDFAFDDADGLCRLVDWKTGREEENHRDQLMAYALWARQAWDVTPERIRLDAVYLREGQVETVTPEAGALEAAGQRIAGVCRAMEAACDDPRENTATVENFPMTDDRRECARCFFQSVCYREEEWPCRAGA